MLQRNISRLKEAVEQLRSFQGRGVNAHDPEFKTWKSRTHRVLHELFGASQYLRGFSNLHFCEPRVHVVTHRRSDGPQWLPMDQRRFNSDAAEAERLLQDAIEDLEPSLPEVRATPDDSDAFWAMMHPTVRSVAQARIEAQHYADAAEAAFKAVNARVKAAWKATGQDEKDGKQLMLSAFSAKQPAVRLDDLSTDSGRDIQEGYMHIFAGSIQAIRNPKAHDNITITFESAMHFLMLASLLMHKLDEAGVT